MSRIYFRSSLTYAFSFKLHQLTNEALLKQLVLQKHLCSKYTSGSVHPFSINATRGTFFVVFLMTETQLLNASQLPYSQCTAHWVHSSAMRSCMMHNSLPASRICMRCVERTAHKSFLINGLHSFDANDDVDNVVCIQRREQLRYVGLRYGRQAACLSSYPLMRVESTWAGKCEKWRQKKEAKKLFNVIAEYFIMSFVIKKREARERELELLKEIITSASSSFGFEHY